MSVTIWAPKKSLGARRLARAMNISFNDSHADTFIRWRRMDDVPHGHVINKRDAVVKASNKYESLKIIERAGVKTVPVSRNIPAAWQHTGKIVFGRDFYHTRGRDIQVMHMPHDELYKDYYTLYMKPDAEYRYHVAFGKVILPTKKVLGEGQVDDSLIRNHQDGKWVQVVSQMNRTYAEACVQAVEALGLDFGAVDFLTKEGVPYILEVNTAPGLEIDNRLEAYSKAFKDHLERR